MEMFESQISIKCRGENSHLWSYDTEIEPIKQKFLMHKLHEAQ